MSINLRTVSNELLINTITDTFISIQAISLRTREYKVSDLGSIQQQQTTKYFLFQENKDSLLSPGEVTKLHGLKKDRKRKKIQKLQSTTKFKRKRLTIKVIL